MFILSFEPRLSFEHTWTHVHDKNVPLDLVLFCSVLCLVCSTTFVFCVPQLLCFWLVALLCFMRYPPPLRKHIVCLCPGSIRELCIWSFIPPSPPLLREQHPCQSNSRCCFRNFWNRVLLCAL